ncbi:Plasmodium exported protein (Pm-fam-a like), unknown function, partial [Plasmodium malariae]
STLNKFLCDNYNIGIKIETKNYRLLAKYKQDKDSNYIRLKEDIQNNRQCQKNNIYNNEIGFKGKNKKTISSKLNKAEYYTEYIDYNNGMFDGKHFHFEKKWIRKKDYNNFLEKNRRIRDIALKKIKFRNYGFGVAIFVLFFLFGIGFPILYGHGYLSTVADYIKKLLETALSLDNDIVTPFYAYILFFSIILIILSIIIIVGITKILTNNEKYQQIKLISE